METESQSIPGASQTPLWIRTNIGPWSGHRMFEIPRPAEGHVDYVRENCPAPHYNVLSNQSINKRIREHNFMNRGRTINISNPITTDPVCALGRIEFMGGNNVCPHSFINARVVFGGPSDLSAAKVVYIPKN